MDDNSLDQMMFSVRTICLKRQQSKKICSWTRIQPMQHNNQLYYSDLKQWLFLSWVKKKVINMIIN